MLDMVEVSPRREESTAQITGSVRKLREDRGYGFIAGDDGVDYFFHWTGMDRASEKGFRELAIYDRVKFDFIMQSDKGPRAIRILTCR